MCDENKNKSEIYSSPSNIEFFENHPKVRLIHHSNLVDDVLKKKI